MSGSFGNPYNQGAEGYGPATSSGFDWGSLLKSIGTYGNATANAAGIDNKLTNADAALKPLAAQVQLPQSAAGRPINAQGINSLLQMLNTRRDLYQQAAMNPQGGVPQPARPVGLLGY